jgi:hypothetical protein
MGTLAQYAATLYLAAGTLSIIARRIRTLNVISHSSSYVAQKIFTCMYTHAHTRSNVGPTNPAKYVVATYIMIVL